MQTLLLGQSASPALKIAPKFYSLSLQILESIKNAVNKAIVEIKAKYSASTALIFAIFAACQISAPVSAATPSACETPAAFAACETPAAFAACETPAACEVFTSIAVLTFFACETFAACVVSAPKSPSSTPLAFFSAFSGLEYAFFAPKAFFFCAFACAKIFFSVVLSCSMALYKLLWIHPLFLAPPGNAFFFRP